MIAGTVSNLTDARYFAARSAKWLGFNMDQLNPNALPRRLMRSKNGGVEIRRIWDVTQEEIIKTVEAAGLDGVLAGHFTSRAAMKA